MNVKKAFKVIFVDFFGVLVGILNAFLIPKMFTIDQYSFYKTFGLYATYAGVFHLGFCDGIYILYGGKSEVDINNSKTKGYYKFLIKLDTFVFTILLIFSLFFLKTDLNIFYFAVYVFPFQIVHFFRLYYRAIGEFNKYFKLQGTLTLLNLVNTIFVAFIFKSANIFIILQIIQYFMVAIYINIIFNRKIKVTEKISSYEIKKIIKVGFTIMIANTVSSLFFSLDRWFIKLKFTSSDFAYYSFAISMLNLFLTLVSSLTILFYPYMSKNIDNHRDLKKIKKYIIIITSFSPLGYFILQIIIKRFLFKYIPSLDVLGVLILSIPFICITNVIYTNLYKASKNSKMYLKTVIIMLITALGLCILLNYMNSDSVMISYSTLLSFFIWYIYSAKDFKYIKIELCEIAFFLIYFVSFEVIRFVDINDLMSFAIFGVIMMIDVCIFFRNESMEIYTYLCKKFKNKFLRIGSKRVN